TVDESHNNPTKYCLLAHPSGKRSPLGEKHAHLCGDVPLEKPPLERFTALNICKFTATWFVSYSLLFAEKRQKEQTKWQIQSLCQTDLAHFLRVDGCGESSKCAL